LKRVIIVSLICLSSLVFLVFFGQQISSAFLPQNETYSYQGKLEKILYNKELRVVLDYNSINYFIYKGEPHGFQYDLLKEFCADNNLKLKISVSNDINHSVNGLVNDEFDLVAKSLLATHASSAFVDFTQPLLKSKIVLVQRKNPNSAYPMVKTATPSFVKSRSDLMRRDVHVSANSSLGQSLIKLSRDLGNTITIVEDSLLGTEQLIAKVAKGDISYTVCKENTSELLKHYYPNLDFSTTIAYDMEFSWMVRKNSPKWKYYLDNWIVSFKQTDRYDEIVDRYDSGQLRKSFKEKEFNSIIGGKLSIYDDVIKEVAMTFEFDWRLITSVILKESQFDADAESGKGALGLMQLMPLTAKLFDVFDPSEPRENIRGGVAYLAYLDDLFVPIITDENERLKFVLAAYNAGIGHVMDARRLAMKYNHDPSVWEGSVDYFLQKKSEPGFYNDPVVEHGYCKGRESIHFVEKVLERFSHYQNIIPADSKTSIAAL
jgi:membrane-bound lytic murein transglycosylase F